MNIAVGEGCGGVSAEVTRVHRSPFSGKSYSKKQQLSLSEYPGATLPFSGYEEL